MLVKSVNINPKTIVSPKGVTRLVWSFTAYPESPSKND